MTADNKVCWLGDRPPAALLYALRNQGWQMCGDREPRGDWCLWWKGPKFTASEYARRRGSQRLNHFPNSSCLSTKDSLAHALGSYRALYGSAYSFVPETFVLPTDCRKLWARHAYLKEKAGSGPLWICKPSDQSRGRNISIVDDPSTVANRHGMVAQRYIEHPMLLGGYKVDLRVYVLVISVHPLAIYICKDGIARMATKKYGGALCEDRFSHLTNTSINKQSPTYPIDKEVIGPGCKWSIRRLWDHMAAQGHSGFCQGSNSIWKRIRAIVVLTLLMLPMKVPVCEGCFELFGFDILLDESFKPWLIEVNSSPSLGVDCKVDTDVKIPMLESMLRLVGSETASSSTHADVHGIAGGISGRPSTAPASYGGGRSGAALGLTVTGRCFTSAPTAAAHTREQAASARNQRGATPPLLPRPARGSPPRDGVRELQPSQRWKSSRHIGVGRRLGRQLPGCGRHPEPKRPSTAPLSSNAHGSVRSSLLELGSAPGGSANLRMPQGHMEPTRQALCRTPLTASGYAARSRLKSLPQECGEFQKAFPFSDATANLAMHLKPSQGGREPTSVMRQVIAEIQGTAA